MRERLVLSMTILPVALSIHGEGGLVGCAAGDGSCGGRGLCGRAGLCGGGGGLGGRGCGCGTACAGGAQGEVLALLILGQGRHDEGWVGIWIGFGFGFGEDGGRSGRGRRCQGWLE